ncbi:transposase [Streptomyces sp. 900105755]|uniref:IS110 family transposase n=1 Tax=Streptomyces sp. 900105755 TaxID=3154389 RepID=UPI003326A22D
MVAAIGDPPRFPNGKAFRSYTGLVPKASETGDTDRKGQPTSKAGSSLLRTTLIRADSARHQDPQLARIYYVQMVECAKDHLGALFVVAANLAERFWTVMNRQMPYVICDTKACAVIPSEA